MTTPPRTLLITNPRASRATPATRDLIAHALASVTKLESVETTHAAHARALARDAASAGVELLVAVGGDGTVNEIVNGILDVPGASTALGILPSGGADVFARTLGIPHDTIEAADALVRFIEAGTEPTPRAVGRLDGRAFLFNAGVGLDAAIVEAVDRHPARKRRYGEAYFVVLGFRLFFGSYPRRAIRLRVTGVDRSGTPVEAEGKLALVALSDPFTYLGRRPVRLVPNAEPTRGLSVLVLEAMPTVRTLRILARGFRGRHGTMPGVVMLDGLERFEVTCDPALAAQTDGEVAGRRHRFDFAWEPDAIRVCIAQPRP